jgi:hypothetical protein
MKLDDYMKLLNEARKAGPVCLVLSPKDFSRPYDFVVSNLRVTHFDVEMADKVIVHNPNSDKMTILKARGASMDYQYSLITRPARLEL